MSAPFVNTANNFTLRAEYRQLGDYTDNGGIFYILNEYISADNNWKF